MPRYKNHKKTLRYTNEFKAKAVQLSLMEGVQVQEVINQTPTLNKLTQKTPRSIELN